MLYPYINLSLTGCPNSITLSPFLSYIKFWSHPLQAFDREQFGTIHAKQKTVVATMIRSHQNSLQLVETLLDVYRNETEGLQLQLEPINLAILAEDVAASLLSLSTSRRVYLNLHYGESDFRKFLWVHGDAFQLRRVFANLLTNAINHSPRGAKVELVLQTQSSHQIVQVIDVGAGLKPGTGHLKRDRRISAFFIGLKWTFQHLSLIS